MSPRLSLVIPTRNERENIPGLLRAIGRDLAGLDYELVFVDDSDDGTDALLRSLAAGDPRIVVHHRTAGDGLAGAVIWGIRHSRGDVIGVLDADLQHPPHVVRAMVARMEEAGADVVVASRYLPGAGRPGLPPVRRLISWATRLLTRLLLGAARRSTDPLSGFFLVRREAVAGAGLRPFGFKILLEILARGHVHRLAEVPYVFEERRGGRSKATLHQGLDLVRHLAVLTAASPSDSRPWKFLAVGASGAAVNVAVFWLLVHPVGVHYLYAGVMAGALSTFTNFLLNSAFTWADRHQRGVAAFVLRLGKYFAATGAGYLLYLGILWTLTQSGLVPTLSNILAMGLGGMFNFVVHNVWTWRKAPR